jgi:Ca2+-binding EF-hand superfamily protein
MDYKFFLPAIVVSATLVATLDAAAQAGTGDRRATFGSWDSDGDGRVTQQELATLREERLSSADLDGDGALSATELETRANAQARKRMDRMLDRLDRDGDGSLSAAELAASDRMERMFGRMDADGDGGITRAEFDAARERMRDRGPRGKE